MNAASFDTKDMLVDAGLGLFYEENLWISYEPDAPDNCVTIYDTPSFPPNNSLDGNVYYYSGIQVRVRNNDYTTGMELGRTIMTSLNGRAGETWGDTIYTAITATGEPTPMARDSNNRIIIVINFTLQRR